MRKLLTLFLVLSLLLSSTASLIINASPITEDINPQLEILSMQSKMQAATENNSLLVYVKNITAVPAAYVNVSISSDRDEYFKIKDNFMGITMGGIPAYGTTAAAFTVDVAPSTPSGIYSFPVTVEYRNANMTSSFTQTGKVSIQVENNNITNNIEIRDLQFSEKSLVSGESTRLSFKINNPNSYDLKNIKINIAGFEAGKIINKNEDSNFSAQKLAAGQSIEFYADVEITDYASSGIYTFAVTAIAEDSFGKSYSSEKSTYFQIEEANKFTTNSPRIVIESYTMTPKKAQPGDMVTLTLNLKNIGMDIANDARIILSSYDATMFSVHEVIPEKSIPTMGIFETATVSYSIKLSNIFIQDTPQNIGIQFSFRDSAGKYYTDETSVNVTSIAPVKATDPTDDPTKKTTPRIIIESYKITDTDQITAGKRFSITFVLKNTSKDRTVKNIKASIASSTTGTTSTNIFTPVDASNSFFIEQIAPQGTIECSIVLLPDKSAETKIYPITFNMDYEDDKYNSWSESEQIGISVVQPAKLEISNFYAPASVSAGETFYLSFSYNNKSRSPIYFLSVAPDGGLEFAEGKQEIGSIPSGYSDYVEAAALVPLDTPEGSHVYKILLNFEDASGNEISKEYEFGIEVMAQMGNNDKPVDGGIIIDDGNFEYPSDPTMSNNEEQSSSIPVVAWALIIGGIVVVLVVVVIIVVVVVSKKRRAVKDDDDETV